MPWCVCVCVEKKGRGGVGGEKSESERLKGSLLQNEFRKNMRLSGRGRNSERGCSIGLKIMIL